MFIYFQIFLLFIVSLSVCVFIKNKIAATLLSLILGLFITLELVSMHMGGTLIDYRFYEHLDVKTAWAVKDFFSTSIIFFSLAYIIICFALFRGSRWLLSRDYSKWIFISTLVAGIAISILPRGALHEIYSIVSLKTAKSKSFDEALENLGIDPSTYVTSDEITATAGKNIIVLSLESLERGYLEPPLENLTPNLRKFASNNTFLKMEQNYGSSWTSASMYTVLTGLPSYFKSKSNDIFQNTASFRGSNLGGVLEAAGYNMSYLMTFKEFSGMDQLLGTFNFDVKSEVEFEPDYVKSRWGIHDKDLFEEAKKEISLQANKNKPFAIFLSTISGHFPNGIFDQRMEKVLPKQETELEFMTSAVDHYVGELVHFLEDQKLMEDTVIYIFPDHKLMGDSSKVLEKFKNERGLYLITNANKLDLDKEEPIAQIDVPRIIIDGSEIKTNATFLTDYLKNKNKEQFLNKNKNTILALNEASLKRNNYDRGFTLAIKEEGIVEISSSMNDNKNILPNIVENTLYTINFQNDMRFHSSKKNEHRENGTFSKNRYYEKELKNIFKDAENPTLKFSIVNDSIYGYFQKGEYFGIARAGENEISFSKNELAFFKQWKTTQTNNDLSPTKTFLKSTGYEYFKSYGSSAIFTGLKPHIINRGLNVLTLENGVYKTTNYDTYGSAIDAQKFVEKVRLLLQTNTEFAIIAHDSAEAQLENHEDELYDLGLKVLSTLQKREAYIGFFQDGILHEEKDTKSLSTEINIEHLPQSPEISKRKKDTLRFIAHAGGGINGDTYTNSLEALNLNYKKGFRLFELDIIKTADNIFVAAHDWNQWASKTNYRGTLPPTRQVFLNNPIKKYTPLDITAINSWFASHPDAILVSDKVNTPKSFSPTFIDNTRLMMELFSEDAVMEAKAVGLENVIVSENILRGIRGKELETLKKWDVKYIAISRRIVLKNLAMLKELKDAGIKTYVFTVNHHSNRDETYVIENETDYIYGLYADEWDFRE